jgi:hypothetical protein
LNARSPLTVDGFKRFLDRVEKFIKNTPLSTLYDITSVTVIIDLNPSKENNQFINCVPILDRTHIHYFQPKVKESLARLVLRKAFEEYSDPWCLPIKNNASVSRPHPPVLNAAKKEELTSVFNEVFETLVKEHMGPGTARTGFIERLVSNMARSLRHNKPLVKTEIENYIQAYYKEFSEAKANEDQSFLIHK